MKNEKATPKKGSESTKSLSNLENQAVETDQIKGGHGKKTMLTDSGAPTVGAVSQINVKDVSGIKATQPKIRDNGPASISQSLEPGSI